MPEHAADAYPAGKLAGFAAALFEVGGLDRDKAQTVADVLLEGDLLGHTTHGLALAAPYLEALAEGSMTAQGVPTVLSERGGALCWDGHRLPGPWLVVQAIEAALARVPEHGIAAVAIRESHHIACLAAYLERATARGLHDPPDLLGSLGDERRAVRRAPGAVHARPSGRGHPDRGRADPDRHERLDHHHRHDRAAARRRRTLPRPLGDDRGRDADRRPRRAIRRPARHAAADRRPRPWPQGLQPALAIEALSQGLSGHGRADPLTDWGASVYLQVIDPAAFGGAEGFIRQTSWTAAACRANPPAPGVAAVRLPGQQGLARKREALRDGVRLHPGIMDALGAWADKLAVARPAALA